MLPGPEVDRQVDLLLLLVLLLRRQLLLRSHPEVIGSDAMQPTELAVELDAASMMLVEQELVDLKPASMMLAEQETIAVADILACVNLD